MKSAISYNPLYEKVFELDEVSRIPKPNKILKGWYSHPTRDQFMFYENNVCKTIVTKNLTCYCVGENYIHRTDGPAVLKYKENLLETDYYIDNKKYYSEEDYWNHPKVKTDPKTISQKMKEIIDL